MYTRAQAVLVLTAALLVIGSQGFPYAGTLSLIAALQSVSLHPQKDIRSACPQIASVRELPARLFAIRNDDHSSFFERPPIVKQKHSSAGTNQEPQAAGAKTHR